MFLIKRDIIIMIFKHFFIIVLNSRKLPQEIIIENDK